MINVANVTVIIATLDRSDALGRCLDALLAGDVLPAEVIIVDQSQNDATRLVVDQRKTSMVPIIYIRRQERNASASRNTAIARASCSVVAVTDDDCRPDRGWIAVIERTFASPTAPDAMTGRVLPLGPDESGLYAVAVCESIKRTEFMGKVAPWVVGVGNNVAVKRAWFNCIGGYDERLGPGSPGKYADDTDLFYRLLRAGAHIRYEPDAVIFHERKDKAGRMATRWGYGFGMGAFCGIWLCRGDLFVLHIVVHYLLLQCRQLAGAIRRRQWLQAYQRSLSLRGAIRGLIYGLHAPCSNRRRHSLLHTN